MLLRYAERAIFSMQRPPSLSGSAQVPAACSCTLRSRARAVGGSQPRRERGAIGIESALGISYPCAYSPPFEL